MDIWFVLISHNSMINIILNRGSYISAYVLLNSLSKLGKNIRCKTCRAFYCYFTTSLINAIIQELKC